MGGRRMVLAGLVWGMSSILFGAPAPTPTPWPTLKVWKNTQVPWEGWFKDNALVTDKGKYVHFFLNAQDFRTNFSTKDKRQRLAETALELVRRLTPSGATADLMKVDIVFVLSRDEYGAPRWDSLKRVAHLEFLLSRRPPAEELKRGLSAERMEELFEKFTVH